MPRLIDADALTSILEEWEEKACDGTENDGSDGTTRVLHPVPTTTREMIDLIADQPTIAPAPRWIPVTERLPDIVKTAKAHRNVYRRTDRVLCACLQTNGKRMVKEGYAEFFNDYPEPNWKIPGTIHSVTHWMPLPEPPEEDGND